MTSLSLSSLKENINPTSSLYLALPSPLPSAPLPPHLTLTHTPSLMKDLKLPGTRELEFRRILPYISKRLRAVPECQVAGI